MAMDVAELRYAIKDLPGSWPVRTVATGDASTGSYDPASLAEIVQIQVERHPDHGGPQLLLVEHAWTTT
jgi:hypothetical protein